jgi:hypothetical protein
MRAEYDFASMPGGIRGKHYEKYGKGSNIVVLEPDVAEAFPTEEAVNQALRSVLTNDALNSGASKKRRAVPRASGRGRARRR